MVRTCRSCGADKTLGEFSLCRGYVKLDCKVCCSNQERDRRYGWPAGEFDRRIQEQVGCCACCGDQMTTPCVDHNHEKDQVRDLLCYACNSMLGYGKESPARLRRGAAYLERHA